MVIFGSAIRPDFNMHAGDIDIPALFGGAIRRRYSEAPFGVMNPPEHTDAWFGLLDEPETAFCRSVDLSEEQAITNPYLKSTIEQTGVVVYAPA